MLIIVLNSNHFYIMVEQTMSNVKVSQNTIDLSFSGLYNKSLVKVINDLKYINQLQN